MIDFGDNNQRAYPYVVHRNLVEERNVSIELQQEHDPNSKFLHHTRKEELGTLRQGFECFCFGHWSLYPINLITIRYISKLLYIT